MVSQVSSPMPMGDRCWFWCCQLGHLAFNCPQLKSRLPNQWSDHGRGRGRSRVRGYRGGTSPGGAINAIEAADYEAEDSLDADIPGEVLADCEDPAS